MTTLATPARAHAPAPSTEQKREMARRLVESMAIPQNPRMPVEIEEKFRLAEFYFKSGLYPHLRSKEAVFVVLSYGEELGWSPVQSLAKIYLVQGKPSVDINALFGVADSNGLIECFQVVERTATRCIVKARRPGEAIDHTATFTIEDAKRANLTGKDNWKGYPDDMLFARATGRLLKIVCPGVFVGLLSKQEAEDEDAPAAPAWQMTARLKGELEAVKKAREIPADALKEIHARALQGRKVEVRDGMPLYAEGEYTMLLAALKAYRKPVAAPTQEQAPAAAPAEPAQAAPLSQDEQDALADAYAAESDIPE